MLTKVLATVPVADFDASIAWYERLLGRPADAQPMEGLADWHLADNAWVQVYRNEKHAGKTALNFAVDNLEKHTELEFGDIGPDGLDWRNLPGANGTGSRNWYRMWGTSWTLGCSDFMAAAQVKGASTTGITTQVITGMGN